MQFSQVLPNASWAQHWPHRSLNKCKPEKWQQQEAGVQEATLFSNLWKQAHLEWFAFNVIKLSACCWPIYDLWCQMLAKVI